MLVLVSAVYAKIYVGAQAEYSFVNSNLRVQGGDIIRVRGGDNNWTYRHYQFAKKFPLHTLSFGVLGGYVFPSYSGVDPFFEVDYAFTGKSKEMTTVDFTEGDNVLQEENLKVRKNYSFGMMPGINIKIFDDFSALIGLRLSMTNYTVRAFHSDDGEVLPLNYKAKKSFVFGVEPTVGASYRFIDNLAMRFTTGYNIAKKVLFIPNYLNSRGSRDAGVSGAVSIRPRGLNMRAALIFDF